MEQEEELSYSFILKCDRQLIKSTSWSYDVFSEEGLYDFDQFLRQFIRNKTKKPIKKLSDPIFTFFKFV